MPYDDDRKETHKANSAVAAGGAGAVIGGVAGLAAGLGALAIPGIGPAIAAGPLAVAIGSAGIGAAAGGIIGALTAEELPPAVSETESTPSGEPSEPGSAAHEISHTPPTGARMYLDGLELAPHQMHFEDLEHDYRADFKARDLPGRTYEQFSPAYRYGHTLASDPRFANEDWPAVEEYARREWENDNPGTWDHVKAAVHYAWRSSSRRS